MFFITSHIRIFFFANGTKVFDMFIQWDVFFIFALKGSGYPQIVGVKRKIWKNMGNIQMYINGKSPKLS